MNNVLMFFYFNDIKLDNIYTFYFFKKFVMIVKNCGCEIFIIINLFIIILVLIQIVTYNFNFKYNYNDKPLSIPERWVFTGLLGWYLYIKYYKWYDYIFNYNRRIRRRKKRRQSDKKNSEKKNENVVPIKELKKCSLTRKEYYDLYLIGVFCGAVTVALINFFINGG